MSTKQLLIAAFAAAGLFLSGCAHHRHHGGCCNKDKAKNEYQCSAKADCGCSHGDKKCDCGKDCKCEACAAKAAAATDAAAKTAAPAATTTKDAAKK